MRAPSTRTRAPTSSCSTQTRSTTSPTRGRSRPCICGAPQWIVRRTSSVRFRRTSTIQLTRDEGLDHLAGLVGLRPGLGDPLVLAVLEDVELHVAAGGLVGLDELFLHGGAHVVVERALHDEKRHERDLFVPVENLLR